MRTALVLAVLAAPAAVSAEPWRWDHDDVVHGPKFREHPVTGAIASITTVSHKLFLNDCMPDGCNVSPGWDDSRTNRSSIPWQQSHLDPYRWGDAHWNDLVQCVRDTFSQFDIEIVTTDPGNANHFEVMIAGFDSQLQMDGALGVAPFIPCDGALEDNVMTFVFASMTDDIDNLCWAVAQEASHAWGLDHQLDALDPMTYLYPPIHKEFQDKDVNCGEELSDPRECWCGGTQQNSHQYLMDTFGPADPVPPTATITRPANGAWVTPGFAVTATVESQMSVESFAMSIDGTQAGTSALDTATFTTPESLAGGDHRIEVAVMDVSGQSASAAVDVHVTARCDGGEACADGFACLGGNCLPDATTPGGLGAPCSEDAACITGQCWTGGDSRLCSQACDAGRACPEGFECIGDGDGACWPAAEPPDTGGCAAGGGPGPAPLLAGLGLLLVLRRRRR